MACVFVGGFFTIFEFSIYLYMLSPFLVHDGSRSSFSAVPRKKFMQTAIFAFYQNRLSQLPISEIICTNILLRLANFEVFFWKIFVDLKTKIIIKITRFIYNGFSPILQRVFVFLKFRDFARKK